MASTNLHATTMLWREGISKKLGVHVQGRANREYVQIQHKSHTTNPTQIAYQKTSFQLDIVVTLELGGLEVKGGEPTMGLHARSKCTIPACTRAKRYGVGRTRTRTTQTVGLSSAR